MRSVVAQDVVMEGERKRHRELGAIRRPWGWGALAVVVLIVVTGYIIANRPPGDRETDRMIETLTQAISYPPQENASGLVRATLATPAGESGAIEVLEAEDLPDAQGPGGPPRRLLFRVHHRWEPAGFNSGGEVTACYDVTFDRWGVTDGGLDRVDCPPGAQPLQPPPEEPKPVRVVPESAGAELERLLAALPAQPDGAALATAVTAVVQEVGTDARTGLPNLTPEVDVTVGGADVGIALAGDGDCLFGYRVNGDVEVFHPTNIRPGERTCDAGTALSAGQAPEAFRLGEGA